MLRSVLLLFALTAPCLCLGDKPVQVFILMGQSNMLGEGTIDGTTKNTTLEYAVTKAGLYPYLWDASSKSWAASKTVRNVFSMGSGGPTSSPRLFHNEFLGVNETLGKKTIGPELGIGFKLQDAIDGPVMVLKSCIGNRALGWDLLPPGSKGYDYTDSKGDTYTYAGYHQSPNRWKKGTKPVPIGWEAGIQYDGDVFRAKEILKDLNTYYPGATSYEVAGFLWWQGDKDRYDTALASHYEQNLVALIKSLRKDFAAPNAKFVTASLGQTVKGSTANDGLILDAMLNVDGDSGKYPDFKGNVAAVYSHPYSKGASSSSHYGRNAQTYMDVGQAMGDKMVGLLKGQ